MRSAFYSKRYLGALLFAVLGMAQTEAQTTVSLQPDQDAVVATGPSNSFVANNYGGAGAIAVAGASTTKGEQRAVLRFDTSSAAAAFDTVYGSGSWKIDGVVLRLTAQVPGGNNPVFNVPNVAGAFLVEWIPANAWTEGSGTPILPGTAGVTWSDVPTLEMNAESEGVQSFSGIAGTTDYTLNPSAGLLAAIKGGGLASFMIRASDATMSMVVNSRSYITASNRPFLTITASPKPAPAVTLAATNVTATGAILNATINAGGGSLDASFDYGFTSGYGASAIAASSPVTGSVDTSDAAILTGLLPSTTYHFRAKTFDGTSTSTFTAGDLTFTTLGAPTISVEQPVGSILTNGSSTVGFGSVLVGQSATLVFTLKNAGTLDLTLGNITVDGTDGASFTPGVASRATIAAGASTTLSISFTPGSVGAKAAKLHIASDDPVTGSFDVVMTGTGLNNTPTISSISSLGVNPGTSTGALPFTVGDVETPAGSLTVSAASNNLLLVPDASIILGGSDAARTITVTPLLGKAGTATITITVSDGSAVATSSFVLDVSADTVSPTVSVTQPVPNAWIAEGASIAVTGSASDNKRLTKVLVQLNGGTSMEATLTLNGAGTSGTYSSPITAVPGVNVITVKSLDARGNTSPTVTRQFTYVVPRSLVLNVSGPPSSGSIATPYSGPYPQTIGLLAGRAYTVKAIPKPGYVFDGWTTTNSTNTGITAAKQQLSSLTFIMQSGLTLTANYIVNPFIAIAGTYNGLVHASAASPTPAGVATEGSFTATVQSTGSFSGSLTLDGQSLPVIGLFDNSGNASFGPAGGQVISIPRNGKPPVVMALHADLHGGSGELIGSATQYNRSSVIAASDIKADLAAFDGTTSSVPNDYLTIVGTKSGDGKFTVTLPPKDPSFQPPGFTVADYPQGHGYGAITISRAGRVTFSGVLADATPVVISSTLAKDKSCPLFSQLYSKAGFFSAQVVLNHADSNSDLSAVNALWSRPFTSGQWYPYGWPEVIKTDLFGAKYAVSTGASILTSLNDTSLANAELSCTGGELASPLHKDVNISKADIVIADATFALRLTRTTGAISGFFTSVAADGSVTQPVFNGIVYQKGALAGGHGFFQTVKPVIVDQTGTIGDVLLIPKISSP